MQTFVAGADVAVKVSFEAFGDFIVPDASSVFYTVRDNTGAPIADQTNVPLATTENTTSVIVPVPASANSIVLPYENRTISLVFKLDGATMALTEVYRLTGFIPMTCTPNSVRSLIGFGVDELPDDDLDLVMGYFSAAEDMGQSYLDAGLIAGGALTIAANRAISCQALLAVLPSISFRMLAAVQSLNAQARRSSKVDLEGLKQHIGSLYATDKATLTGTPLIDYSPLYVAIPTDVVTGGTS